VTRAGRHRLAAAGLACLLLAACDAPAPDAPAAAPDAPRDPRLAGLSPNARPDIVEMLREERSARRAPSDGGGRAWLAFDGAPPPLRAGEPARFPIVYEAGPLGIEPGGVLFLQVPSYWGWSQPQSEDPGAPGYTAVATDAAGVTLAPEVLGQDLLGITVGGRALRGGEQVRIDYGAGELGALPDRFAERRAKIFLAVDGDGDGTRGFVADPPEVDVLPGPAALLVATLPSAARPGETLTLRLAFLDREGSAGIPVEGEVALEAPPGVELPAAVPFAPADAGVRSVSLVVRAPGVVRIRARGPGGLETESNPLFVDAAAPHLLWADLHGHSNLSDGTGTPDDYYRYARDVAALDVAALTDHDHWGIPFLDESPAMWREIGAATARFHEPGRFVTLLGYEWTSWLHGHRHVLYFEDEGPLVSSLDEASDDPAELWKALRGRAALTFAHHSAGGPIATNWDFAPDAVLEPVTEVASVHGSSEAPDAPHAIYDPVPGNFVRDALGRGYRLGFVGSGDSHDGHPGLAHLASPSGGLAAVFAREPTREAVLAALRARHCYATNGPRILLEASLGGRPMGAEVPAGSQQLRAVVVAPAPLERIDVVRGPELAFQLLVAADEERREAGLEETLENLRPGETVYLRVVQRDGGAAWSSPFFVAPESGPAGAAGAAADGG
jgi:hypothetical protein